MSDASQAGSALSETVPFPQYSVGVLQGESEMIQAPAHDLLPFLEADPLWNVELYTERTVHALLDSSDRLDCVVVGYNAAHSSEEIRRALVERPPRTGLLVLHQLSVDALAFLAGEGGLSAETLGGPVAPVRSTPGREAHEEILLRWPRTVGLEGGVLPGSAAHLGVTPLPAGGWRTVLDVESGEGRAPVLVRTHTGAAPAKAVCTALLEPRREPHARLLVNLLMWCASGRPTAVVVDPGDDPHHAERIHRKLRLQGTKAVVEPEVRAEDLDLRRWPYWGTRDVLLPEGWDPTRRPGWPQEDPHGAKPWLRRGGRIVLLGEADSLTIRHGESDAHWVAKRWATWFAGVRTVDWHGGVAGGVERRGSIVETRSVLRMLAAVHGAAPKSRQPGLTSVRGVLAELAGRGVEIDAAGLGLPEPSAFGAQAARLLAARLDGADNVDQTISATVAALDIDALVEGAALGSQAPRLQAWLRAMRRSCSFEDRLEIARCLQDRDLLLEAIREAPETEPVRAPTSTVRITALRSAIVACELPPAADLTPLGLDPGQALVETELRTRPMLAAAYLLSVLDLERFWPAQAQEPARALRDPPQERVDLAVVTLGRHGPLARGEAGSRGAVPVLAATEALALIGYFARHPVPTHVVGDAPSVPPQTLAAVLQETEEVRRLNEQLARDLAERKRRAARGAPVLAACGALLILGVTFLLWWVLAPYLPIELELPGAAVMTGFLLLGLLVLLQRYGLVFRGAAGLTNLLGGGREAARQSLAAAVTPEPGATGAGTVPADAGPARGPAPGRRADRRAGDPDGPA